MKGLSKLRETRSNKGGFYPEFIAGEVTGGGGKRKLPGGRSTLESGLPQETPSTTYRS